MVKPIAVMYIPRDLGNEEIAPFELAAAFNGEASKYKFNRELYKDYLWFVFPQDSYEFDLKVFHPKDFDNSKYEELKSLLMEEIKKLKGK